VSALDSTNIHTILSTVAKAYMARMKERKEEIHVAPLLPSEKVELPNFKVIVLGLQCKTSKLPI
jgi:hypothetical protein